MPLATVEIKYMGQIERPTRRGYVWYDGYALVVNGRVQYPWLRKREAQRESKKLLEKY